MTTLTSEDNFIVLACDGLYDVFTNDEVVAFVKAEMSLHGDALKCCQVNAFSTQKYEVFNNCELNLEYYYGSH